jgi:polysaccharide biosynthesis protein PelB
LILKRRPPLAKPSSYSVVPGDAGRSRILSWGALGGIVVLAVVGLVLVFPKSDPPSLPRGESANDNHDPTVDTLRNVNSTEPIDLGKQLLLAEKLLAENDLIGARRVLDDAALLTRSRPELQANWGDLDLSWWQAQLRKAETLGQPEDASRAAAELVVRFKRRVAAITTAALVLAEIGSVQALHNTLSLLGSKSVAAKDETTTILHDLLNRLLVMPSASVADLSRGATLALANARFQQAADLYFAARRRTVQSGVQEQTHKEAQDKLLRQGVLALLAGGQPLLAWKAAVHQTQVLGLGDPLNWWLAELALGAARPLDAAIHLRRVVPLNVGTAGLAKTLSPKHLELAWSTFAAAGDLKTALMMTDAILITLPQSALWLERKAQMAEWSGLGQQALGAWVEILKRDASERALANVFRLSPMLYDDDALLAAWLALAHKRRLSVEEAVKIVDVYERLGSADRALVFLRQLPIAQPGVDATTRATWQDMEARLLERAGRPVEAIAILEQFRLDGLTRDRAMRLAQLHLRNGDLTLALRALQAVQLQPDSLDEDYWSLLADSAFEAGDRSLTLTALDRLIAGGKLQTYQAERAIRLRLNADRTPEALVLAAQLYSSFPVDAIVYAWLDAIAQQKSPSALRELMAALLSEQRDRLEESPAFLERRAGLYNRLGDTQLALKDYRRSLGLRPGDTPTRVSYWWLLVDQQNTSHLRAELAQLGSGARRDPAYAEVMAAAWLQLDQPRLALALMQPLARARANDFLWLMSYADVLERVGREAPAMRVRRHAWLLAQRAAARPADRDEARKALMAQLRLAANFAGGEQKSRLWRELGGLLAAANDDPALQRQAQELAGAWLLSEGRFDTAQRWLWEQQAARMAIPAYQALAVALSQNDLPEIARLIEPTGSKIDNGTNNPISAQDRLTALRQLDRRDEAAILGLEQAQRLPEGLSDEAQQALQDDLLATANRASIETAARQAGVLTRLPTTLAASVALAPRLKLTAEFNDGRYRSTDTTKIAETPTRDRELRIGIESHMPWGEFKAQSMTRQALATVNGYKLQLSTLLDSRSVLHLEVAHGERSDESSAMSLAGVRDSAAARLNLRANERVHAQASLTSNRFRTQTGAALGRSVDASLAANWTLRRDYPDIRVQTQLRRSAVRADGQPDAATKLLQPGGGAPDVGLFLGPSSTVLSASLGIGLAQTDPAIYSRTWRPWGEVGFETRQTIAGRQTQALFQLGAKGSVIGRDQLSVNLDVRPSTGGLLGIGGTRELRLRYEIIY